MELRIKDICKQKGLLQKELAEKVGVTDIALRASLKGNPTVGTLEKVANALNVEVWELFTESPGESEISGFIKAKGTIYEIKSRQDIENLLKSIQ
ncbi:helix-turn-helix transcriptional regulator [Parabacteroides sp. BX2]|jgi:transcriptional regulator with XRE-family HTH domain|uniref:Helix-turn-helix transcriptional regulator n=1 Tax=Parabacteroides segnis TaxID=2763058 RepID=A0ABR7E4J7_9BACT|nr:helix-turn-helix transcriptional regulator [Parabacteroides segnis]MBC5644256.1 helix-turn-helix transcriptional regulator [Parabacteroides segnis]DAZ11084.1 MAG TPA: helix-turn-helix domain protein [Caudoviricetes sp.]